MRKPGETLRALGGLHRCSRIAQVFASTLMMHDHEARWEREAAPAIQCRLRAAVQAESCRWRVRC
jgi:hypothetical protein